MSYLINYEVIWLTVELFYDVTKRCTNSIAVSLFVKVQTLVKDLGSNPHVTFLDHRSVPIHIGFF